MNCPLCQRDCPESILQRHHLQTRRKDKTFTELICRECHKTIHGLWSNADLRDGTKNLDNVEGLLENETFLKALRHICKVPPGAYMKMRQSKRR